jgi:hypothetical protein
MTQIGRSLLIWVGSLSCGSYRIRAHRDYYTVNAVSKHYHRVLSRAMLSSAAFDNINRSASTDSIRVWAAKEEHAKRECVRDITVMDIYDIKMERHEFNHSHLVFLNTGFSSFSGRNTS